MDDKDEYKRIVREKYGQIAALVQQYPAGPAMVSQDHDLHDFAQKFAVPDYFDEHHHRFGVRGLMGLAKILCESGKFPDLHLTIQKRNRGYSEGTEELREILKEEKDKAKATGQPLYWQYLGLDTKNPENWVPFKHSEVRLWKAEPIWNSVPGDYLYTQFAWFGLEHSAQKYIAGALKTKNKDVEEEVKKKSALQLKLREDFVNRWPGIRSHHPCNELTEVYKLQAVFP